MSHHLPPRCRLLQESEHPLPGCQESICLAPGIWASLCCQAWGALSGKLPWAPLRWAMHLALFLCHLALNSFKGGVLFRIPRREMYINNLTSQRLNGFFPDTLSPCYPDPDPPAPSPAHPGLAKRTFREAVSGECGYGVS